MPPVLLLVVGLGLIAIGAEWLAAGARALGLPPAVASLLASLALR